MKQKIIVKHIQDFEDPFTPFAHTTIGLKFKYEDNWYGDYSTILGIYDKNSPEVREYILALKVWKRELLETFKKWRL